MMFVSSTGRVGSVGTVVSTGVVVSPEVPPQAVSTSIRAHKAITSHFFFMVHTTFAFYFFHHTTPAFQSQSSFRKKRKKQENPLAFVQKYVIIKLYDYGLRATTLCTFL
jgi:hypothetical protein